MSTDRSTHRSIRVPAELTGTAHPAVSTAAARTLAALRIATGFLFLWAFLDKLFGWHYTTASKAAWLNGGSPTKGFLGHVQVGPFQAMFRDWAGATWADWLFMLALAGVGIAVVLGVALRVAAGAGTLLLALMWLAEWPLAQHNSLGAATSSTNPLVDYHVVYALVLVVLALTYAGDTWGFGRLWRTLKPVRRNHWLF
jgi:thiosulfate dehydrogenase [quinone] large subunit